MMRRLLLLLLALGLWQFAFSQIHCGLEPPDCQEGACELCHLADVSPAASDSALLCSPPPTLSLGIAQSQGATVWPLFRHYRGRAPPH